MRLFHQIRGYGCSRRLLPYSSHLCGVLPRQPGVALLLLTAVFITRFT